MPAYKHCDFFLLRYIPDVVKGEFVNIGVILLEEGDDGFTDVRFTRDWRRVRCADPDADIELLESYESDLRRLLQSRTAGNHQLSRAHVAPRLAPGADGTIVSGALGLAPMKAVLTESPSAELGILAQAYLESPRPAAAADQSGRRVIYNAMRDAFETAGVWHVHAAGYRGRAVH